MADNQREPREMDLRELLNGLMRQLHKLREFEVAQTNGWAEHERAMLMLTNIHLRVLASEKILNGTREV